MWCSSAVSPFTLLNLALLITLTVQIATRVVFQGIASNCFRHITVVPDANLISSTIIENFSLILQHGRRLRLRDARSPAPLTSMKTQVAIFADCATEIA
jgi:hypothetical protein